MYYGDRPWRIPDVKGKSPEKTEDIQRFGSPEQDAVIA